MIIKLFPGNLKQLLEEGKATFESRQLRKDGSEFPVEVSAQVVEFNKEKTKEEIQRSKRFNRPLCLLMIDLDNFKHVNDEYGHLCGDMVLRRFGKFIKKELRDFDIPIRFGGEEFCILLPETDLDGAWRVGERIRKKIFAQKFESKNKDNFYITCSIGAGKLEEKDNYDSFLQRADGTLYQAKEGGKNRLERRQHMRFKINPQQIKIKTEKEWQDARLIVHSSRGIQLDTKVKLRPAQQITVNFNRKTMGGEVRWVTSNSGEYPYKSGVKLEQTPGRFI